MRLNLILPKVEPTHYEFPKKCPRKGCPGMRFIPRQEVSKKIVTKQVPGLLKESISATLTLANQARAKNMMLPIACVISNNHCERAIGWWIKERYRSMRGYKQKCSALGMSRLIAFAGNNLARGLRLADLMA